MILNKKVYDFSFFLGVTFNSQNVLTNVNSPFTTLLPFYEVILFKAMSPLHFLERFVINETFIYSSFEWPEYSVGSLFLLPQEYKHRSVPS